MNKYKVALVDDDPTILMMIKLALENYENLEILTFDSGESFLELYEIEKPDILITDYHMDSVNVDAMKGSDLIISLRNKGVNFPIIILSSQDNMKLALELSKFQVADYVEKSDDYVNRICSSIQDVIEVNAINGEMKTVDNVMKKDYNHLVKIVLLVVVFIVVTWSVCF